MDNKITITMTRAQADEIQFGLSDIACWIRGFIAACPEEYDRHPIGLSEVRDINIKIKDAIRDSDK